VANRVSHGVTPGVPKPAKRQRIADQIKTGGDLYAGGLDYLRDRRTDDEVFSILKSKN
jgi:hypothetical protein